MPYDQILGWPPGTGPGTGTGTLAAGGAGSTPFNINPAPQGGQGPYGAVPGAIGLPPVLQDLQNVYPNLTNTTAQASQNILAQLRGQLSPETISNIEDESARFGITSGMPGSGLQFNRLGKNIGLSTEALQNQGLQNYLSALPTVSKSMTISPELQAEIASRNALFGAAPDPASAASELQNRFLQGLNYGGGGGGGRGSGSIRYSPSPASGGSDGIPPAAPGSLFGPQAPNIPGYGTDRPAGAPPVYGFPGMNFDQGDNINWDQFNDPSFWDSLGMGNNSVDTQSAYDPNWDFGLEDLLNPTFGGNEGDYGGGE